MKNIFRNMENGGCKCRERLKQEEKFVEKGNRHCRRNSLQHDKQCRYEVLEGISYTLMNNRLP